MGWVTSRFFALPHQLVGLLVELCACFPDFSLRRHSTYDRQVVTSWMDIHWILWRRSDQKHLEIFDPSLSLSFSDIWSRIFVFYGSHRLNIPASFLCWRKQFSFCFLCWAISCASTGRLSKYAALLSALMFTFTISLASLCVCLLHVLWVSTNGCDTVVERRLSILPFIYLLKDLRCYSICAS